ncbi:MAG: hypothetical protein LC127_12545 [Chitinophagales bacterium]|nr:hypothetical protein [Chitinophagales bacterium]
MIKFLLRFFLPAVILVCSGFSPGSSTISSENVVLTNLCYDSSHDLKKILLYDLKSHSFLSTDCNNPTVLPGGGVTGINYTGTNLYYTVTIPAGTHLNGLLFNTSDPDLVAEIISDCIGQTVMPPPFCDGGTFLIRVSSPAGNATTFDLNVDTYQFNITITPSDNPVCEGEDLTLQANVTGIPGTVASYAWSNGDNGQIITITDIMVAQAGVYVVTVTDVNGCTDEMDYDVEVFAFPTPVITVTEMSGLTPDDGIVCEGADVMLAVTDVNSDTRFEWDAPDGTHYGDASTSITGLDIMNIDMTLSGTYTVTAYNHDCSAIVTIDIIVNDAPEVEIQHDGSANNFEICEDEPLDLDATITGGSGTFTYDWELPDGTTMTGNPITIPAELTHDGTWTVTVTDANGCTGEDDIQVTVNPAPDNKDCGSAFDLGTGFNPINFKVIMLCTIRGTMC